MAAMLVILCSSCSHPPPPPTPPHLTPPTRIPDEPHKLVLRNVAGLQVVGAPAHRRLGSCQLASCEGQGARVCLESRHAAHS